MHVLFQEKNSQISSPLLEKEGDILKMYLKSFDSSLTKAVLYIFKASFFTAICTLRHRQFQDMLKMPGVKSSSSYVSNSSHTLSPAYVIQTYKNHIRYGFFSQHFFNKVRLNIILTG